MGSNGTLGARLLTLEPQYRERVWGGRRLAAPDASPGATPIGEAWVGFEASVVRTGPEAGRTVAELAAACGPEVLGSTAAKRFGPRFPLLAKLLDCADWLSVQVHPNDEQARRLVGPDEFGKTEAWYFLEAEPDARILLGVKEATTAEELAAAIRARRILDVAAEVRVSKGDAVLIPAGMLHALGPGLLLYEIQQASDTTYRVYDWDRPETAGRKLHIDEAAECTSPLRATMPASPADAAASERRLVACPYFELDLIRLGETERTADTRGRTFHLLTVTNGPIEVRSGAESVRLERFETLLVAASAGSYRLRGLAPEASLVRAGVPEAEAAG